MWHGATPIERLPHHRIERLAELPVALEAAWGALDHHARLRNGGLVKCGVIEVDVERGQGGGVSLTPLGPHEEVGALVDVAGPCDLLRQPGSSILRAAGPEEIDLPGCVQAWALPTTGEEPEKPVYTPVDVTPDRLELRQERRRALRTLVTGSVMLIGTGSRVPSCALDHN